MFGFVVFEMVGGVNGEGKFSVKVYRGVGGFEGLELED